MSKNRKIAVFIAAVLIAWVGAASGQQAEIISFAGDSVVVSNEQIGGYCILEGATLLTNCWRHFGSSDDWNRVVTNTYENFLFPTNVWHLHLYFTNISIPTLPQCFFRVRSSPNPFPLPLATNLLTFVNDSDYDISNIVLTVHGDQAYPPTENVPILLQGESSEEYTFVIEAMWDGVMAGWEGNYLGSYQQNGTSKDMMFFFQWAGWWQEEPMPVAIRFGNDSYTVESDSPVQ